MKNRRGVRLGSRSVRIIAGAAVALVASMGNPRLAPAAAPAPWHLRQSAGGPAAGAPGAFTKSEYEARLARSTEFRDQGVDRVYPQFALNPARYPRGGVAHRNILVVLAQFPSDQFGLAAKPSSKSTPRYYQKIFFSEDPDDGITSVR